MFKLALGAGHGASTPGKRLPAELDPKQTAEWWLNDRVADLVEYKLGKYQGYELLRLDDSDDGKEDVALAERVARANAWGADFYLSLHHNAAGRIFDGGGIVAYTHPQSSKTSVEWRNELYDALIKHTGLKGNRSNPKATSNLYVLRKSNMPAVLLELGFMDSTVDAPIILSQAHAQACADAIVEVIVRRAGLKPKANQNRKYTVEHGVHTIRVPAEKLRVVLCDCPKESMGNNCCNAGFFGGFSEKGEKFTLPAGHLVADYEATGEWTEYYCKERGVFAGNRFRFDSGSWAYMNQFLGKAVSTLVLRNGKARIEVLEHAPGLNECDYAIAGIPIMERGEDVKFHDYVTGQGWDASSLYGTWHVFAALTEDEADTVHLVGMRTTTGNMIRSAEAYMAFKAMGYRNVIKLDGGGSFYMNVDGTEVHTWENRRICTKFYFGD